MKVPKQGVGNVVAGDAGASKKGTSRNESPESTIR